MSGSSVRGIVSLIQDWQMAWGVMLFIQRRALSCKSLRLLLVGKLLTGVITYSIKDNNIEASR